MISSLLRSADPYRSMANPMWSRSPRGVVESVRPITPTASAITIRTNRSWTGHRPGQFVTIGVEIDGVRHHRCYSLTSVAERAGAQLVEIAVQRVDGGLVSTHLTRTIRPGDLVHLDEPAGDFVLPTITPDRLLFVSGGSGITPIMGMLRSLAARPPHVDVTVVHHAPTPERTMFAVELGLLAAAHDWLTVHVVHTQAGGAHLSAAGLDELCPDWRDRDAYVCGPASLVDFATDHWAAHDALERLHLERFTLALPTSTVADPGAAATAHFTRSGVVAAADTATTLLDAAEAAGLPAPYGCRSGVCHTCSTKLLSGCTRDLRDGRLNEAGTHVQLCVNAAAGDVALDL
ncbi:MAG: ferredoxin reductase [Acidimicrobiales bacterium]